MGISYGGALALKCALDYPDHIDGVMTVAMLVDEPRGYVKPVVQLANLPFINPLLPQHLKNAAREVVTRRPQIGPLFNKLQSLTCPVTIVHGDRDHLVSLTSAHRLRHYFSNDADISLEEVAGGSHFLECEQPDLIYSLVAALKHRALQAKLAKPSPPN